LAGDVRYWHKADIGSRGLNVCFGGKAIIHGPEKGYVCGAAAHEKHIF
jgi:hypothetical protein